MIVGLGFIKQIQTNSSIRTGAPLERVPRGYWVNNFVIARGTIFEYIELDGPAQGNKREAENFKILSQKF